jgi:hypothetical protein
MLHDDEIPTEEYAGYLEAQLLGARLLAAFQNRQWTQKQTHGRDVYVEEEQ